MKEPLARRIFTNPSVYLRYRKRKSFYETGTYHKKYLAQYHCHACHYETFSKPKKRWSYDQWHYR